MAFGNGGGQGQKGQNGKGDIMVSNWELQLTVADLLFCKDIGWRYSYHKTTSKQFIHIGALVKPELYSSYQESVSKIGNLQRVQSETSQQIMQVRGIIPVIKKQKDYKCWKPGNGKCC